jgi:hypothetical protein
MQESNVIIIVVVACVTLVLVVAVIASACVAWKAFANTNMGGAKSFGLLFRRGFRLGTVALVVFVALLLAILGKLSDGAVTLLSGIAGVLIGGMPSDKQSEKEPPAPPS